MQPCLFLGEAFFALLPYTRRDAHGDMGGSRSPHTTTLPGTWHHAQQIEQNLRRTADHREEHTPRREQESRHSSHQKTMRWLRHHIGRVLQHAGVRCLVLATTEGRATLNFPLPATDNRCKIKKKEAARQWRE